ncbi:MAG: L-fucose/L-arabinose isomerase family protein, partial [Anaerolineae bacterium]
MTTLAVIVGNRGFFPSHLAKTGSETILRVLDEEGFGAVCLTPDDTEHGAVVSFEDSVKCAELFRAHAEEIDGILVTLPNFGEERGIADAVRLSGLNVPVLVQATPDDLSKMDISWRRDSFCGKMSACNNLTQYGVKYSLTTLHTVDPESQSFREDLQTFGAVCRVVNGLRRARFGQLGARPAAFITVRYSEKLLEKAGISIESIDLSEVFGRAWKLGDDAPAVTAKVAEIKAYLGTDGIPEDALLK